MARNQSKRLSPAKIEANESGFAALRAIKEYTPINRAYSLEAIRRTHAELENLRRAEAEAAAAMAAAREGAVAKEWEFHNLMLGVKEQIIAQFGKDSNEVEALGLKRKSDYKPPTRKSIPSSETAQPPAQGEAS
jgi:hypothetical protein